MLRVLLYAFLIWFLYKLIFDFIIPVYKTTRQIKKKFREMHDQMQRGQTGPQGFSGASPAGKSSSSAPSGDYIDFEEVK